MPPGYVGRAFLYVLVAAGPEDLLKIGLTHDPLARWSSFHPRWFEAFDVQHSMLIETDSRAEAQALETGLQILAERKELTQPHGRLAFAILLAYLQVEAYVLTPRVMARAVAVPPAPTAAGG